MGERLRLLQIDTFVHIKEAIFLEPNKGSICYVFLVLVYTFQNTPLHVLEYSGSFYTFLINFVKMFSTVEIISVRLRCFELMKLRRRVFLNKKHRLGSKNIATIFSGNIMPP